jgi:hypothetical protein
MRHFSEGEKVRIYSKTGSMKEYRWIPAVVLEANFDDGILVESYKNKIWIEPSKVKHLIKFEYDQENHCWPEVKKFETERWDRMKKQVVNAMKNFFPNKKVNIDEKEKIIKIENLFLSAGIEERETFDSFIDVACWSVSAEVCSGGSYTEPPSVEEVELGERASDTAATRLLIESLYKSDVDWYFDNLLEIEEYENERSPLGK